MRTETRRHFNNSRNLWMAIIVSLALIVAAGTTYFLISPAATMEAIERTEPTEVESAHTSSFIELNLYDYYGDATASTNGKTSVNGPYYSGYTKYPAFQWNGGAYKYKGSFDRHTVDCVDFGNSMITDYDYVVPSGGNNGKSASAKIPTSSSSTAGINRIEVSSTYGITNRPIGFTTGAQVINYQLINGYPALTDGTSLEYLFNEAGGYAKKLNGQSIDGLFQQDPVSGAYYYNSRTNHAQFNSTTTANGAKDTFTLYDQIITPNFILYPFGNFLPLNEITDSTTSTQVSQITSMTDYVQAIIDRMNKDGADVTESQLIDMLTYYKNDISSSWSSADALDDFFNGSTEPMDKTADFELSDALLQEMYNIDYDVDTNFFFGMDMSMQFIQPKDGLTGKDTNKDGTPDYPMVFYFTGDDDVWAYVDGVLFMDLSGIHRHVGGKIDFVKGQVHYYYLDTAGDGDVVEESGSNSGSIYKTYTFRQLLAQSGKYTVAEINSMLTSVTIDGKTYERFKDYSEHTFNFYYMERGSGSSVCRINFNFPIMRDHGISVTKEVTADEDGGDLSTTLGDPDYCFQIWKEGGKELFIGAGEEYTLYNNKDEVIGTGTTDENGIFKLKAGQTALFSGIKENEGRYFVRELIQRDAYVQYGRITSNGESVTKSEGITVGSDIFLGADSPVKDIADGITYFTYSNQVDFDELGRLKIRKTVDSYKDDTGTFDFDVSLDGTPLAAGTEYTVISVDGSERTEAVETEGIITLADGETAEIERVLAGSVFEVAETEDSSEGYQVRYGETDAVTLSDGKATGYVKAKTPGLVEVQITNIDTENPYELPETGGMGTVAIVAAGLLMVLIAAVIMMRQSGRREE